MNTFTLYSGLNLFFLNGLICFCFESKWKKEWNIFAVNEITFICLFRTCGRNNFGRISLKEDENRQKLYKLWSTESLPKSLPVKQNDKKKLFFRFISFISILLSFLSEKNAPNYVKIDFQKRQWQEFVCYSKRFVSSVVKVQSSSNLCFYVKETPIGKLFLIKSHSFKQESESQEKAEVPTSFF